MLAYSHGAVVVEQLSFQFVDECSLRETKIRLSNSFIFDKAIKLKPQ